MTLFYKAYSIFSNKGYGFGGGAGTLAYTDK